MIKLDAPSRELKSRKNSTLTEIDSQISSIEGAIVESHPIDPYSSEAGLVWSRSFKIANLLHEQFQR